MKQRSKESRSKSRRAKPWWNPKVQWFTGIAGALILVALILLTWSRQNPASAGTQSPVPGESDLWALVDARNNDGSKAILPSVISTHENLRFDERDRSQPDTVSISVGYRPHAVLTFNLKGYEVQRIVQDEVGVRQKARVWIELPMSRWFEKDWFMHMEGLPLTIGDVSPQATFVPPARLRITEVMFTPKATFRGVDAKYTEPVESLLAVVTAQESLPQAAARHWQQLVQHLWVDLLLPIVLLLFPSLTFLLIPLI